MFHCHVCGNTSAKPDFVNEVFTIDGRRVLIEHVPAEICTRCKEPTFHSETADKVRKLVHESPGPARTESLEVFELV